MSFNNEISYQLTSEDVAAGSPGYIAPLEVHFSPKGKFLWIKRFNLHIALTHSWIHHRWPSHLSLSGCKWKAPTLRHWSSKAKLEWSRLCEIIDYSLERRYCQRETIPWRATSSWTNASIRRRHFYIRMEPFWKRRRRKYSNSTWRKDLYFVQRVIFLENSPYRLSLLTNIELAFL